MQRQYASHKNTATITIKENMITFATQEDFENAVMKVLRCRLGVRVITEETKISTVRTKVTLFDALSLEDIDSDSDYA